MSVTDFKKMQTVGDSVEGEYLGTGQFELGIPESADPDVLVSFDRTVTIHYLRPTGDRAAVGIFGRPSLNKALAGKKKGQRIRIALERKVEVHPGVFQNQWAVKDLP